MLVPPFHYLGFFVVALAGGVFHFHAAHQELLGSSRALLLFLNAVLKKSHELVVARALGVVDVLLAGLGALERVVEYAHECVLVILRLRRVEAR